MARTGGPTRRRRWYVSSLVATGAVIGLVALAATRTTDSGHSTQTTPKTDVKPIASAETSTRPAPATATTQPAPTTTIPLPVPTTTSPPPAVPTTTIAPGLATGVLAEPAITSFLASRQGDITAAVYDYDTGQLSLYRPGVAIATASVIKLAILETLLSQAQAQGRGLTASESRLATEMIEQSDNDAATALWDEVGGAASLNAFGAQVGLTDTGTNAAGYWGLSTTTAADQITLLRNLTAASTTLDPANQAYALSLMGQVESDQAWGVSGGVAPGTVVQLKNGWLSETDGWYVNSVGVVTGTGHHYAVAVLTSLDANQDYGEDTIEGLSGLLWAALAH